MSLDSVVILLFCLLCTFSSATHFVGWITHTHIYLYIYLDPRTTFSFWGNSKEWHSFHKGPFFVKRPFFLILLILPQESIYFIIMWCKICHMMSKSSQYVLVIVFDVISSYMILPWCSLNSFDGISSGFNWYLVISLLYDISQVNQ